MRACVAPSAVTIATDVNPSLFGQAVIVSVSVPSSSSTAEFASGLVTISTSAKTIGTVELQSGGASLTVSHLDLPVGSTLLEARSDGDSNYLGSTSTALEQSVRKSKFCDCFCACSSVIC